MKKFGLITVLAYLIVSFTNEAFAVFGESCEPLPSSLDKTLKENTAYGHIMNCIDMVSYIDKTKACATDDKKFMFCLRNKAGSQSICKQVTMNIGEKKYLHELTDNTELISDPFLKNIPLTVGVVNKNMLCLKMPTSRGMMPVACKKINKKITTNLGQDLPDEDNECSSVSQSCYGNESRSQSLVNFSGLAVSCVGETLNKVFFKYNTCRTQGGRPRLSSLGSFSYFQEGLKTSIRAALVIYVMMYGFKLVMNGEYANLNKVASFLFKFLLVAYFSVGLGPIFFQDGKETRQNGMLEYGVPVLSNIAPAFANIVFNASGSKGLCDFDVSKYQKGYENYAIWDAIDCRIAYYLGMQLMYNISDMLSDLSDNAEKTVGSSPDLGDKNANFALKSATFGLFTLLFAFCLAGNVLIVVSGMIFAILFISIVLQFITHYLVCLITLYVMAYISPIFIPMALFEQTKSYFDSWLKITISCSLQPAILAGSIALLLTMYDSAIYKNCQFERHDYKAVGINFSTFELRLPYGNAEQCKSSAGYKLLKYYLGQGWEDFHFMFFSALVVKDIFSVAIELLYVLVFSIIFYFFSKSMVQFAADITSGPIMDSVVASPTKIVDQAKKAYDAYKSSGG